jgi:hypothetical protein
MDEIAQLLISQLAGGADQPSSLADVVEQSLGEDPLAGPLATLLRKREASSDANPELDESSDPEIADLLESLYAEVESLRERVTLLADALGACPRCFGEDDSCPVCHGRGRPGGRQPDASLFLGLVEPARRRISGLTGELAEVPETAITS